MREQLDPEGRVIRLDLHRREVQIALTDVVELQAAQRGVTQRHRAEVQLRSGDRELAAGVVVQGTDSAGVLVDVDIDSPQDEDQGER